MTQEARNIWRYGQIDVMYELAVDGTGRSLTPSLISLIKERFGGAEVSFATALEWCAGAGFIGFGLLEERLCTSIRFADINPMAIECINETIDANHLQERAIGYVSDNLGSVPVHERFDLVVGNPPAFWSVNPAHPSFETFRHGDQIGSFDPGWKTHREFYRQITPFLNTNAIVILVEVELFKREVFTPGCAVPFDIRPMEPQITFGEMIQQAGLTPVENAPLDPGFRTPWSFWAQISQKR